MLGQSPVAVVGHHEWATRRRVLVVRRLLVIKDSLGAGGSGKRRVEEWRDWLAGRLPTDRGANPGLRHQGQEKHESNGCRAGNQRPVFHHPLRNPPHFSHRYPLHGPRGIHAGRNSTWSSTSCR